MSRLVSLRALLAWRVPSVGYPNTFEDHGGHRCELCRWLQGRQTFRSSSTCQSLSDRGRFKCLRVAMNLLCPLLDGRQDGDRCLGWCHTRVGRAPAGLGPQSPRVLTWQTVSTGSPALTPSLQRVSETYSSLNWESVTYLNCFSDLIRIFHLQQAILKYCLYTNSHSE